LQIDGFASLRIQIICTIDEQSSYKLILLSFTMVCRDLRSLSTICKRHPTPNSMNTIAYVNVNKEQIINNYRHKLHFHLFFLTLQ